MHFHSAMMELIRDSYGLGPGGQMNFYKWSPQKECFVGFDQAYVKTQLGDDEFFNLLRASAESDQYQLDDFLFGYFLQYKVVSRCANEEYIRPRRFQIHHTIELN
jgi:hypothetical protein